MLNLINFYLYKVDLCGNNQDITNIEEAEDYDTNIVAKDPNISTAGIDRVEELNKSIINIDRVED